MVAVEQDLEHQGVGHQSGNRRQEDGGAEEGLAADELLLDGNGQQQCAADHNRYLDD